MNIPEKITIAGITYKIEEHDQNTPELQYGEMNGQILYNKTLILLNKELSEQQKEMSLIHELAHAVCYALCLSRETITIDERFIESFSQLWYQIIQQLK